MAERQTVVALTGGTGFVGRHVLTQLLASGYQVRALVRDAKRLSVDDSRVTPIHGDLFDPGAVKRLVKGADAVIHLVGIIMENPGKRQTFDRVHDQATASLVQAATEAGVKRWIHMSALGARPGADARYHLTKWEGEKHVRKAGLDHTIFRPSIIHGHDGEFMEMVRDFWCKSLPPVPPFVPYFGNGQTFTDYLWFVKKAAWPFSKKGETPPHISRCDAGQLQPVFVDDVAKVFVDALSNETSVGETYSVGGPEAYTWPDLYETCRKHIPGALGKPILAIPVWKAKLMAKLPGMPFNEDQVIMSQENSTCETVKLTRDFDFELAPFEPTLAGYAKRIGKSS